MLVEIGEAVSLPLKCGEHAMMFQMLRPASPAL